MELWPIGFSLKRLSLPGWKETLLHKDISAREYLMEERMRKIIIFLLTSLFLFASQIYVATAANLTYVMPKIVKIFNKKYPDIKVKFITSSSGKLTAQILNGAPYDLFLSANMKYPNYLYNKGIGIKAPEIYAKGTLGIISLKFKNVNIKNLTKYDSIAISKPNTTPYGHSAILAFKKTKIYNKIKDKLVYAETIPAVLSYIRNGADVGVISKSIIYSNKIKNLGKFYYSDIDSSLYPPINQGVLLISKKESAKKFYNFLLSKDAKKIFKKYGYQ